MLYIYTYIVWKVPSLPVLYNGVTTALPGAPCSTIDPTSCRGAGDGRYMAHDASAFGSHHGEKWMDLKYPKRGMKEVDQKK